MRALPALVMSCLLTGCPTRDRDPPMSGGGAAGQTAVAAGAGQAGAGGMGAITSTANTVTITSPTTVVYTNGTVTISVATSQPATSSISVIAAGPTGSQTIGTVPPSQTSLSWNTSSVPEGSYSLTAQLAAGGTVVTSASATVIVDRTAPRVVPSSLIPAPGASNVVFVAPITIGFSEPVRDATVNANSISIQSRAGTNVPSAVSLSSDGTTATVNLTSDRTVDLGTFTGVLSSSITDLAGNPLAPLTVAWTWTAPPWIPYAGLASTGFPLLAVGRRFQPFVAYTVCGPGSPANACPPVAHVAFNDGQAWNDLGVPAPDALPGALFVDAQNRPTLAWASELPDGSSEVSFATWNGMTWSPDYPSIRVSSPAAASNVDTLGVALDSMDRPILAYRATIAGSPATSDVYVAAWTGTAWNTSYGSVGAPLAVALDVLVGAGDTPVVTVTSSDRSSGAFVWNGTAWDAFGGSAAAPNPSAGLDAAGNPTMLSAAEGTWLPEHLTGGSWLPSVSVAVPCSSTATSPWLTSGTDALPVVAWYEPAASPAGVAVARWTGTGWDSRAGVANAGGSPGSRVIALVDGRNDIWIAWMEDLVAHVWMSNY